MTRLAVVEKHTILQSQDAGVKSLEVVIALVVKEFKMSRRRRVVKGCRKNVIYFLLRFSPVARFIFFSVRERAIFYKSCNLIGSESGQYSPHRPAHSGRYPILCFGVFLETFQSPFNISTEINMF